MVEKKKTTTSKAKEKAPVAAAAEPKTAKTTPSGKYSYANGKRKTAVAKVRLYKGTGVITVNQKPINEYFTLKILVTTATTALKLVGGLKSYDITATVLGGGISSQAEAIRHGITKSLIEADITNKPTLKKAGLLTRDSRVKERKKFGLKRARKAPQFSKR
jgi:small subunit ribosomal protein S9